MRYNLNYEDRVEWTYKHSLGGGYIKKTKTGVYLGIVNHRTSQITQMAKVLFDLNKTVSLVPLSELRIAEPEAANEQK